MQDCVISKHATDCVYVQNTPQVVFLSKHTTDFFYVKIYGRLLYVKSCHRLFLHPNIPQVVFLLIHTIYSI